MLDLAKQGEGVVTAADIEPARHDVEVDQPRPRDRPRRTRGGQLDMQIKVETGRGYVPGNLRAFRDEHCRRRRSARMRAGRVVLAGQAQVVSCRGRAASSSAPTSTSW
jgi:hypothetical protein